MKAKELRLKSKVELEELLAQTKKEFVEATFQHAIRKLKSHSDLGKKKKLIAQIYTILPEKN